MKKHPNSQPYKLGESITVHDDYDGVEFTYIYAGGPVRRFRDEHSRALYYHNRATFGQLCELIEFLFQKDIVQTPEEAPYAVIEFYDDSQDMTTHPIPEHLHRVFDALRGDTSD